MPTLDIFNDDAFSVTSLTGTIIDMPRVNTPIGNSGIFREYGITTTSMFLERTGQSLKLVSAQPRGGVGEPVTLGGRTAIPIGSIHLPQTGAVLADEVQNVRAFGKETEVETVLGRVREKLVKMKLQLDLTLEFHRMGAIQGLILDADGTTTLSNLYTLFDFSQTTFFFDLVTTGTDVKQKCIDLRRAVSRKLGGMSFTKVRLKCSETFFDAFVGHSSVKKAYELYNANSFARTSQDSAPFEFADVIFEVYSGGIGDTDFITADYAYAYPEGVAMFETAYSPADYMETVNTTGLPYYAKQEMMPFGKGIKLEAQSNPITVNTRPELVFKCSKAAS